LSGECTCNVVPGGAHAQWCDHPDWGRPSSFTTKDSGERQEIRATSESGGQKGRKSEEYALIPSEPLAELARVYGYGASKYSDNNWRKGYPYSWSLSALYRHIEAFRRGQSADPESGRHHLAHAAFHLFTLIWFDQNGRGEDDRADVLHD
jgi:hypothetical protein